MLVIISILLSASIVGLGVWEGRRWFGAYRNSLDRLNQFASPLATCKEGTSFMEVARGWIGDTEAATRSLARNLLRHFGKEPIVLHGRQGWVVDVDELCDGKHWFKTHPAHVRIEAMPGLLMGAGILFTFLGLAVGVFGLDPTDADQLTQGVKKLLGGMSMAFLTSIAGIGTALWWSFQAREMGARYEGVYAHIAEILHDKTFILMPEEMNYQFLEDLRNQGKALENMENSVYRALVKAFNESIFVEIRDLLARTANMAQENESLSALKDIHKELKIISHNFSEQGENQRLMGKALKRILQSRDDAAKAVVTATSGLTPQAQTQFVAESLKLTQNFQNIHQSQENTINAINESAEHLKKLMKAARLANADIIKLHGVLVKHLEGLESHWANYRGQLETMQNTLSSTLDGFKVDLGESLQSVHGEFDELLARGLNHFAGAMQDFQNTLTNFSTIMDDNNRSTPPTSAAPKPRPRLFGKGT